MTINPELHQRSMIGLGALIQQHAYFAPEEENVMDENGRNWKKIVGWIALVLVAILLVIQIIPLDRDNPAVVSEPNWDSPHTRELAKVACFDCHSNETVWPWYARITPSKLLLWFDVRAGRQTLNFSDWATHPQNASAVAKAIDNGGMPPFYYVLMHSEADLTDAEKQQLIDGLRVTFAQTSGAARASGDAN